jgi:osmotically-inducible protein OsmY
MRSRFLFIDTAAQRAKQLRRGASPRIDVLGQPAESIAIQETLRGLVDYKVTSLEGEDNTSESLKEELTMAVTGETRTDAHIQSDVLAELRWEPRVQPNEIGVVVKNGVVTLTGWVDSYTKRWAAEDAAHRVRDVKAVANDIEVRLSSDEKRTDADLAAAVVRALEWDAFVSVDDLDVTVEKGWVTLKGQVEWQYQRKDAERVVRRLASVTGVTNLITVKPRVAASELKKKIEKALVRSVETDAKRITVEADGDSVILKGTVKSWAEREEAERAAWAAPGVASVDNRITIGF